MEQLLKKFRAGLSGLGVSDESFDKLRIIVGFSGGADSTLLLRLALKFFEHSSVTVEAAHLNHMIRGAEADRDEAFCRDTADSLGITLHVKRVDIPALAERGEGGVEEIARRERYAFFEELATRDAIKSFVATAHNANDNLETVLFNLARGTALRGLCGIPPKRDEMYIRPLLSFESCEIREACGRLGISYVDDSTNFETEYTRNYIRANVIPPLEKHSPMLTARVTQMCTSLRRDEEYLSATARTFLEGRDLAEGVENRELVALHDAVLSRVITFMYTASAERLGNSLEGIHITSIISALRAQTKAFRITVPGGISFYSDGKASRFVFDTDGASAPVDKSESELVLDSVITKNGYNILLTADLEKIKRCIKENIYNLSIYKAFDFDKINGSPKIRTRLTGDIFYFGGMTRKVKKLFSERRFTPDERDTVPLIVDDSGILWIPTFPTRDGLTPAENSRVVYCFVFK